MANPNSLAGKTPAQTYQDVFYINNSNNGLDSIPRILYSGNGLPTTISISDDKFAVDCNYANIQRPTFSRPATLALSATHAATGAYVVDLSIANFYVLTLEGNISSMSVGGFPFVDGIERAIELTFFIIQGMSGSFTVSWPSGTKWAGGVPPVLTTTKGLTDVIGLFTVVAGVGGSGFVEVVGWN